MRLDWVDSQMAFEAYDEIGCLGGKKVRTACGTWAVES